MADLPPTEPAPLRACVQCGAPQDEQQEICVECGTPAPGRRGVPLRPALRPLALALFAVLIVTSAAYGLTADVGRNPDQPRQVAALPTTPPAAPAPAPALPATTPAPPADPAPPAPSPPADPAPPSAPSPAPPPSPTPGPPATHDHTHTSDPRVRTRPHRRSTKQPAWLKQGDQPYSATLHDPYGDGTTDEHSSAAAKAVDGKAGTSWTTADHPDGLGKPGVGLVIDTGGYQSYSALGIQTKTPGFSVSIYATDQSDPPTTGPDGGGWTLEGSKTGVAKEQRITLKGRIGQPQYLLVWITKLPAGKPRAGLSEVSLLP